MYKVSIKTLFKGLPKTEKLANSQTPNPQRYAPMHGHSTSHTLITSLRKVISEIKYKIMLLLT